MYRKLLKYLMEGHELASLEIRESTGNITYSYQVVKTSEDELILQQNLQEDSLEALLPQIKKDLPLCIVINTEAVLTKLIQTQGKNDEALVLQAFPNLNLEEFYYEILSASNSSLISIARKAHVHALLDELEEAGLQTVEFQLGLQSLSALLPYMEFENFRTTNWEIGLVDHEIRTIQRTNQTVRESYSVSGYELYSEQLLSFGVILGHIQQHKGISNFTQSKQELKTNFSYKRATKLLLKGVLASFLIVLLINFLFYSHYHGKSSTLNSSLEVNMNNKLEYEALEQRVNSKRDKIALLESGSWSNTSYYLDQIAQELPSTILLDQLIVQPFTVPIREGKELQYKNNIIQLSGSARNSEDFSLWLNKLENKPWVKKVETSAYGSQRGSSSNFIIEIEIHEIES